MLLAVLNAAGIIAFAISGALVGVRKNFDIWGIATMGVVTGVGGGILRDVFLGINPPTSVQEWPNAVTALIGVGIAVVFDPGTIRIRRLVVILDAVGMGLFAASGAAVALDHRASGFAAIVVGITTAIGGGVIRDVLARETPLLLQPADLYAVPVALGAVALVAIEAVDGPRWVGLTVSTVIATALRLAGLRWKWRLPTAAHLRWQPPPDRRSPARRVQARFSRRG